MVCVSYIFQYAANGGNLKCINWGSVVASAGLGAVGGGLANGLYKGAFRFKATGSNSWSATKQWFRRRNNKTFNINNQQQRHHWLFQQNQGVGRNISNRIKNQPWNVNPVSSTFNNWMSRGNTNLRSLFGAPPWAKGVAGGSAAFATGKLLDEDASCDCNK